MQLSLQTILRLRKKRSSRRYYWRVATRFLEVQYGSIQYMEMLKLRERELRMPIGLSFTTCDLKTEGAQHHFGILNTDRQLCACVLALIDGNEERCQLRQMVVEPSYQGLGVGRLLYEKVESWCRGLGVHQIQLNARLSAKDFYGKLGFSECGVEFNHVTLPHIKMTKVL